MGIKKIIVWTMLIANVAVAIASYFTITAGLLAVLTAVGSTVMIFLGRFDETWRIALIALLFGLIGITVTGLGVYGLMGEVSKNCHQLEPTSEEGIICFNAHYDSSWGLHHLLTEK